MIGISQPYKRFCMDLIYKRKDMTRKVLVMDDDVSILEALEEALSYENFQVRTADPRVFESLGTYGCNSFISKPFGLSQLVETIDRVSNV